MEGVNQLNSKKVEPFIRKALSAMLDLRLIPTISGEHPLGLSFGSSTLWYFQQNNHIIGVLIASTLAQQRVAEMEWLFVKKEFRNQGIGKKLVNAALDYLKGQNIAAVSFYYTLGGPETPTIEALLKKYRIPSTQAIIRKYKFNPTRFNPLWLEKEIPLPLGFTFFPWNELTPHESALLQHRFDQFQIPRPLSPFHHPHLMHQKCSVGVRSPKGIVGWGICHWIQPHEVEYSSIYVDKEQTPLSLGFCILAHTIRLIKEVNPPKFVWMNIRLLDDPLPTWSNFIKKRLSGWADEILEVHRGTYEM